MAIIVAAFGKAEDITNPGLDGKVYRFPVKLIDRDYMGTPRQPSKTTSIRISVEISNRRIKTWNLNTKDLLKVAFEIAKEYLTTVLNSSAWKGEDLKVTVNTYTHKCPCPFDPTLIHEPTASPVEIEVKRPIGFM